MDDKKGESTFWAISPNHLEMAAVLCRGCSCKPQEFNVAIEQSHLCQKVWLRMGTKKHNL